MKSMLRWPLVALMALAAAQPAAAQSPATTQDSGWDVSIYPILGWLPLGIDFDLNVPSVGGGGGTSPDFGGQAIEGRFDGAFFGGLSAQKGKFRIDADGLWAAVGGDRADNPFLRLDVDAIYGHGSVGFALRPGLFVTGGVRRMAFKYDIELAGRQFESKPGYWNPLVGLAYHSQGTGKVTTHAFVEGGGFGVGTDADLGAGIRFDYKPTTHFGITAGYNFLYLKVSNEVLTRAFTIKQTLHGPVLGIGFYF
jgi:hypothetical protein